MMKDVRKVLATFRRTQFLQGVIFKSPTQKDVCWCWRHINSYRKHVQHTLKCGKLVSKLFVLFKKCENNFLSEIASKCSLGKLQMQKRVVVQLKGECFAPPSAMNYENALSWADSGMGVGSPSFLGNTKKAEIQSLTKHIWCEALSPREIFENF